MSALDRAVRGGTRSADRAAKIAALWRATVAEVVPGGVWVVIPALTGPTPIGPIPAFVQGILQGDSVVVGAIADSRNDLAVIATSAPPRIVVAGVTYGLGVGPDGTVVPVAP